MTRLMVSVPEAMPNVHLEKTSMESAVGMHQPLVVPKVSDEALAENFPQLAPMAQASGTVAAAWCARGRHAQAATRR